MLPTSRPADTWSPLYFLTSVGAGGIAISFFMYLLFWIPHPDRPVPIFEDVSAAMGAGAGLQQLMIIGALVGIAAFGTMNLYFLGWNLRRVSTFLRSERGVALSKSNGQTQVLALPLALAMSVNVVFVMGMVFVPGLWTVVEYLFPLAMAVFVLIGGLALREIGRFLGRVISSAGFDCRANNSFSQALPAFSLALVGVGLAAPAAMSNLPTTAGVAIVLSGFFFVASLLVAAVAIILGLRSMLENGINVEQAPTLMIVLPLTTILGILVMRQGHGLHEHFGGHASAADTLTMLTGLVSLQVLFLMLGLTVLRATGYLRRFISGSETSVGSYALVCPGVAFSVMLHFWINKGLVDAGLIDKFGTAYWTLSAFAIGLQLTMVVLILALNRRHFRTVVQQRRVAA